MVRELKNLLEGVDPIKIRGTIPRSASGLAYDSRDVKQGYIFFALKGIHTDGHKYINKAVKNGAVIIFHSDDPDGFLPDICYIQVRDTRFSMSPVSAAFYGNPSEKIKIMGVTGTNGKSTTVAMIYQLLSMAGIKTGFISTVQFDNGTGPVKNHYRQSTPEATEIHKILNEMVENGCTHAVIEATSHGLSAINNRLGDVRFDGGVYTNISHEHLEFHKTLDRYIDDKANLFRAVNPGSGFTIVNRDDPYWERFSRAADAEVLSYGIRDSKSDLQAINISGSGSTAFFDVKYGNNKYSVKLNLPGIFNVENAAAALLSAVKLTGLDMESFLPFMEQLTPAEGRMITVDKGQNFEVLVDYAHSPGSFELLFPALREMTSGRLISLFGSAGERDIAKRSVQGAIADRYSHIIILTDEDPRGEDPMKIIKDIASGCSGKTYGKDLFFIPDRMEAIKFAFKQAGKDDLVVLLGKGHESSIIYKDGSIPWKERNAAEAVLNEMGYK